MGINRFSRPTQKAGYKAMSFQELAFAPIQLRQREDAMMNQKDEILNELSNIEVYDGFQGETDEIRKGLQSKLDGLAKKIQTEGANNMNLVNDFRNLRNQYNQEVSKTGNIGKAAGLKQTIDSQKDAYFKYGLAAGQSPSDIERNWSKYVTDYTSKLPSSISKHKGSLPNFDPGVAPKHYDIASYAAKFHTMLGALSEEHKGVEFKTTKDEFGNVTGVDAWDKSGQKVTNKPQVQSLVNLLERDILDPGSGFHQDLLYKGQDPQQYIETIGGEVAKMMLKESSSESLSYKGQTGGNTTGSSRTNNQTGTQPTEYGSASLVATGGHYSKVENSETSTDLLDTISEIEKGRVEFNDPQEREKTLTMLRSNVLKRQKLESNETFRSSLDRDISGNQRLKDLGLESFEDFEAIKDNPEWHIPLEGSTGTKQYDQTRDANPMMGNVGAVGSMSQPPNGVKAPVTKYQLAKAELDKLYSKNSKPLLAGSEQFTLGMGGDNTKLQETLGKDLKLDQLKYMAAEGKIDLLNSYNPNETEYNKLKPSSDEYASFVEALSNGEAKFEFGALNSGSAVDPASMLYSVTIGTGENKRKMDFSIDLANNGFSRDLLREDGPIYQSLNREARNTVTAIRENLKYQGLATSFSTGDGAVSADKMFEPEKSANVIEYANVAAGDEYGVALTGNPTGPSKLVADNSFIKPGDYQYSVALNDDGSFSTYRRNTPDGTFVTDNRVESMTIDDFVQKKVAGGYVKDKVLNPLNKNNVYSLDDFKGEKGIKYITEQKRFFAEGILTNVTDLDKLDTQLHVYNSSPQFKSRIKKYQDAYFASSGVERQRVLDSAYEDLSRFKLQTKSKKLAL